MLLHSATQHWDKIIINTEENSGFIITAMALSETSCT